MTPDERRAIEWDCSQLILRYANLNDESRWEDVAALYTLDGSMARPTAPDTPVVGREAILASLRARPPRVTQHVIANVTVDVESPTSATAFSGIALYTAKDAPPLLGYFKDRLVLTDEGWRFAERRGGLTFA
jgi:hypothetical protein